MLTVEDYAEIRRAHRDGMSIRAIAKQNRLPGSVVDCAWLSVVDLCWCVSGWTWSGFSGALRLANEVKCGVHREQSHTAFVPVSHYRHTAVV